MTDDRDGFYLWVDQGLGSNHNVGLLCSAFEHAEVDAPEQSEITAYYSRNLSEYSRLHCGNTQTNLDDGDNSTAFLVQFTNSFDNHAHGANCNHGPNSPN
ncbi:MAG: hypothetical protein GY930_22720 [bacterium]|nr:hypothetical protein [bacterium]